MNIALLDDYQDSVRQLGCFAMLAGHDVKVFNHGARGIGQLAIRLAPFDVLVLNHATTTLSRPLIERLPKLKLIVQIGNVGPHLDIAAAQSRGIVVREIGEEPHAVAELTWALIMAARRKLPQYAGLLKQGAWQLSSLSPQHNTLGYSLHGQTLGLWGYGRIGRQVAAYAQAFGMHVLVWGGEGSHMRAKQDGWHIASSREALFCNADILTVHLRHTEATRGLIGPDDFARMKPDALFVNTSDAGLVQSGALEAALQQGRPGSAALDVFEQEALSKASPLLHMENVLATPHVGAMTRQHVEALYRAAFQQIVEFVGNAHSGT
jgi:D-3-phosphoglycerate dehydrogenase